MRFASLTQIALSGNFAYTQNVRRNQPLYFHEEGGSLMNNQFSKELLAFAQDHIWVNEHLESLLEEYAEQWIAVKNRQVIASDVDLMRLREKISDPAHTCIEFVTREPLDMLL